MEVIVDLISHQRNKTFYAVFSAWDGFVYISNIKTEQTSLSSNPAKSMGSKNKLEYIHKSTEYGRRGPPSLVQNNWQNDFAHLDGQGWAEQVPAENVTRGRLR